MGPVFQYYRKLIRAGIYFQLREGGIVKHDIIVWIALALFALTVLPASADERPEIMPMDGRMASESYTGNGKINSVDVKTSRINLSHGLIPGLDLKGMTGDFEVQDKALMVKLKKGQKVTFQLIEIGKGKYVISEIFVIK